MLEDTADLSYGILELPIKKESKDETEKEKEKDVRFSNAYRPSIDFVKQISGGSNHIRLLLLAVPNLLYQLSP